MLHAFIINSFAGNGCDSDLIRSELESKRNLEYVVFNSEYAGHEGVLAGQIYDLFPEEIIRFYACGGSGTLRNIMAGLPDFKRAQFACLPSGATNDFLDLFGKKKELFRSLDNLIEGEPVEMDYISSNCGCSLNTLSCGYDVRMVKIVNKLSSLPFGISRSSYGIAAMIALFSHSHLNCSVEADGVTIAVNADMVILGNGCRLGGSFHVDKVASPVDGRLTLIVIPRTNIFKWFRFVIAFLFSDWDYITKRCVCKHVTRINVYPKDEHGFEGNCDGELVSSTHLEAKVVSKGVCFVVPKGIDLSEVFHEED